MMAIAGIIPVVKWLAKIKQLSDVSCRLCKRAREQRDASTENLPEETYGHINSAFCDGMATTVTAAKESGLYTLSQEEEFEQICSRESLTEKAAEIEKTISVKEHERERYDFDPTMFYEHRFWNRRPDGIVINKNHRTLYILECKQSSDRNEDFLRAKEDDANEQHKSIIEALKAAAPEWTFEQINFVAGRRGAVVEDDFYNKLERLNVQAGKRDKFWRRMCNAYAKRMT